MIFSHFANKLNKNIQRLKNSNHHLYKVELSKGELNQIYLNSYPVETRQSFNCNSCRSFLNNYGALVVIENNKLVSIWRGLKDLNEEYSIVANNLADYVEAQDANKVKPFYTSETTLGTIRQGSWSHFYALNLNSVQNKQIAQELKSTTCGSFYSFNSFLKTVSLENVNTTLDLINHNNLYRGEQHKNVLLRLQKILTKLNTIKSAREKTLYIWDRVSEEHTSVTNIKNTSIGRFLSFLGKGDSIEQAKAKYDAMVNRSNYRVASTDNITENILTQAKNVIDKYKLSEELESRRLATPNDLNVNNTLYLNRAIQQNNAQPQTVSSILNNVKVTSKISSVIPITLESFISEILSKEYFTKLEILLEKKHSSNLMNLLTSDYTEANNLIAWQNNFTWTYNKGFTDSEITKRVKNAGGLTNALLRTSLAWNYTDDLDIHLREPGGFKISYRQTRSSNGGFLDVDANCNHAKSRTDPVENIAYSTTSKPLNGEYKLTIHNYDKRGTVNRKGFKIEIQDATGKLYSYKYNKTVRDSESVDVCTFIYQDGEITSIKSNPQLQACNENSIDGNLWNLETNKLHEVTAVTWSPNYWQDNCGNKHLFLFIKDLRNNEPVKAIFNEYINPEYIKGKNKKVFGYIGGNLMVAPTEDQLAGLGFSTTIRNSFICAITTKENKKQNYEVKI